MSMKEFMAHLSGTGMYLTDVPDRIALSRLRAFKPQSLPTLIRGEQFPLTFRRELLKTSSGNGHSPSQEGQADIFPNDDGSGDVTPADKLIIDDEKEEEQ